MFCSVRGDLRWQTKDSNLNYRMKWASRVLEIHIFKKIQQINNHLDKICLMKIGIQMQVLFS